ncbi:hypothetical protein QYE76_029978 [Lolium multiflorum]|uniref:Ubiquitin thioesterase OTU n=1 Tax=Lolium multiflorum TaxID=4521 RepID=A0AAD8VIT9_LOLMU|nr:hypothetical protein QYE76_029978 [Lolium multiflorum]
MMEMATRSIGYREKEIQIEVSLKSSEVIRDEAMKHVDATKKSAMPPKKLSKGLKRHLKRLKAKPSIPGDGRCLFRSVVHGACVRSGKAIPNEDLQRKLADELRSMVADEFVSKREETEWFVEGDFDTYVSQIRQPHVWGGEPELFMASHVLQ